MLKTKCIRFSFSLHSYLNIYSIGIQQHIVILSRCTEMNSFEEKLSIDYDNQVSAFVWERCQMLLQKRIFPSIAHNYIE